MHFYLVAPTIRAHSQGFFTYQSENDLAIGSVVMVEIGKRESVGVVIKKVSSPDFKTKDIIKLIE